MGRTRKIPKAKAGNVPFTEEESANNIGDIIPSVVEIHISEMCISTDLENPAYTVCNNVLA